MESDVGHSQPQAQHHLSTRRRVARLPDLLVNQIAAGEVVERPASVIKELVENSLDAGASRIDISLKQGGTTEINIVDNGVGMELEDLLLSVERHTTSKLSTLRDLDTLGTFGFRGEALSSIGSVAEMEIKSRTREMERAYLLRICHGERVDEPCPIGAPPGTTITVRGLFERLPARQKFLRSTGTEFSHSSRLVKELALGNPGVAFYLYHQGAPVSRYVAKSRESRFAECFKVDWTPLHFREEADGAELDAFLSPPGLAQTRGELFLFINGRGVRHRTFTAAIRNAYQEVLGPTHEPSGVVFLDLRKEWVDVNVHPQKWEVRCLRQEMLYSWLANSVRKALAREQSRESANAVAELGGGGYGISASPVPLSKPLETAGYRFLGLLKSTYMLCEDGDGLLVVDWRALARRLRLTELRREQQQGHLPRQALAVPRVISVSPVLLSVLAAKETLLSELGFDLESFGEGDLIVKSHPLALSEDLDVFLKALLTTLQQSSPEEAGEKALRLLAESGMDNDSTELELDAPKVERWLRALSELQSQRDDSAEASLCLRLSHSWIDKQFERT